MSDSELVSLAGSISKVYDKISADPIAGPFCLLIICWLGLATLILLSVPKAKGNFFARFIELTPNSLASLGVLGTFTGILLGLIDFDVQNIDASVPKLLAGMMVAFTTSVVGLGSSILFRAIRIVPSGQSETDSITPDDIHQVLNELLQESKSHLTEIRAAISSEGDGSLLTQVQKLRTSVQDGNSELVKEFKDFAKNMADNNQEALIEALQKVITDFNEKLTEQFGENFKQLNAAVEKLVGWQEKYREHVEVMEQKIEAAVKALEDTSKALETVKESTSLIPAAIEKLDPALVGITNQSEQLQQSLSSISELRDKAIEAFPVIEGNLNKITTDIASSVEDFTKKSEEAATEAQRKTTELLSDQFVNFDKLMQEELERSLNLLGTNLASLSEKFVNDYQPLTEKLRELIEISKAKK